jgi:AcrR family transcriptional regulator
MAEPVNPKRRYQSARRSAQAADTRGAVLDAARGLFVDTGWQKTTIAAIARAAGVSAETIYAVFGSKTALLEALVALAIRGAQPQTPLLEQAGPRAIAAEHDQRRQLDVFARDIAQVLSRVAPLVAVVRSAAESDPQLAALYRQLHAGRRRNLEAVAEALLANGPLRHGLDREAATSAIWRLASPELFLLLRDIDGLTTEAYADWLAATLVATLLA